MLYTAATLTNLFHLSTLISCSYVIFFLYDAESNLNCMSDIIMNTFFLSSGIEFKENNLYKHVALYALS